MTALGTATHDLVFAPLLVARRAASRVSSSDGALAAFDAQRLVRGVTDAIPRIVAARYKPDTADHRGACATLEQAAAPLFDAFTAIGEATSAFRGSSRAERPQRWHAWCEAVQRAWNEADAWYFIAVDVAGPGGKSPGVEVPSRAGGRTVGALAFVFVSVLAAAAPPAEAQRTMVRVVGASADSLTAAGFDVVGQEPGSLIVVADPYDRARLAARGARVEEIRSPLGARLANAATATTVYRSFDDPVRGVRFWIDSLAANNPRVSVDTIGRSFEGRPMLAVKIGPRGESPQRPNALFLATYHAREWAATETALRLIRWLAAPPGTDARRDSLVAARDIWVIPVANPDGYQYTFSTERLWRKTRSPQSLGATGADMNRNHSVSWGLDNQGSSPDPRSDIFRGATAASEIETRNIEAFHVKYPPVVAISYHTYSGLLLYPPGQVYGALPADLPVYQALAGTHLRSAVSDRVPGTNRTVYAPSPGWQLYTTNGEYTDYASARFGTLAFTTELTSGYTGSTLYGFEFPDDEAMLERVFQDNLPFALDLLDAARDPVSFRGPVTQRDVPRLTLESASPEIRAILPARDAVGAGVRIGNNVSFRVDSAAGGKYTRRITSAPIPRPAAFTISGSGLNANFRVLNIGGAEAIDDTWQLQGFSRDSVFRVAGRNSWFGTSGTLRSPTIAVPTTIDTVTVAYWTMHSGSGFTPTPSGRLELSTDAGSSWSTILVQRGSAPVFYPDRVTVGGVAGKSIAFRFVSSGMPWRLDEIAIVGHAAVTSGPVAATAELAPSENPVRSATVSFAWPFGAADGEIVALDFAGRIVWRGPVRGGVVPIWNVESGRHPNGVYLVVARAGGKSVQLKLFVTRRG